MRVLALGFRPGEGKIQFPRPTHFAAILIYFFCRSIPITFEALFSLGGELISGVELQITAGLTSERANRDELLTKDFCPGKE